MHKAFRRGVIPLEAGSLTKLRAARSLRPLVQAVVAGGPSSTVPGSGLTLFPCRDLGHAGTGSERPRGLLRGPLWWTSSSAPGSVPVLGRGPGGAEPPPAGRSGGPSGTPSLGK